MRATTTNVRVKSSNEEHVMIKLSRLFFVSTALSLFVIQSSSSISYSQSSSSNFDRKSGVTKPEKSTESIAPATAPEKNPGVITDPLVRVLISKGVLNDEEGRSISISGTPSEQRNRLAVLLRDKGLLSAAEYEAVRTVAPTEDTTKTVASAVKTTALSTAATEGTTPATPQAPAQIAAVAPVRLLGIESPKREGLIPDIKLGTGARIKLYGFFKTSIIHDSSSPQGNDFPLPLLAGDTGPNSF